MHDRLQLYFLMLWIEHESTFSTNVYIIYNALNVFLAILISHGKDHDMGRLAVQQIFIWHVANI